MSRSLMSSAIAEVASTPHFDVDCYFFCVTALGSDLYWFTDEETDLLLSYVSNFLTEACNDEGYL